MFGLGTSEILIVLVIALLVFGPQKLPEIGRQIGGLMREFRRMSDDVRRTFDVDELTGLNRYDDPYTRTYTPNLDYGPDLSAHGPDGDTHPRLDQQLAGFSGDDADTYHDASARPKGGAAVYEAPRPWSVAGDDDPNEFNVTASDATHYNPRETNGVEPITNGSAPAAHFAPLVSAAPPGPPNGGDSSSAPRLQQKEQ